MDLLIDQSTKDLVLDGGDFKVVDSQLDLLAQRLFVRFKTFKRELFWNKSFGIDYLNKVFGINIPKNTVDALFQSEIVSEEMVSELVSYNSTVSNYSYSCNFKVRLQESSTVIEYYILQNGDGMTLLDQNGNILTARIA